MGFRLARGIYKVEIKEPEIEKPIQQDTNKEIVVENKVTEPTDENTITAVSKEMEPAKDDLLPGIVVEIVPQNALKILPIENEINEVIEDKADTKKVTKKKTILKKKKS